MKNKFEDFVNNLTQEEKDFFLDIKKEYLKEKENIRLQKIELEKRRFKPLIYSEPLSIEMWNYERNINENLEKFLYFLQEKNLIIFHINDKNYQFCLTDLGIEYLEN